MTWRTPSSSSDPNTTRTKSRNRSPQASDSGGLSSTSGSRSLLKIATARSAWPDVAVDDATFAAQADTFDGVETVAAYTDVMMGMLAGPLPDGGYTMKSFAVDEERGNVMGFAVFHGTQTGEGGPVPPTGKRVESDYVYCMEFEDGKIRHMTKVWNDGYAMRQLGWGG